MLFIELSKIDRAQVTAALRQAAAAHGIDPDTLEDGLTEVLADALTALVRQAAEADRDSFRARQKKGMAQAIEQGKPIGRPSLRTAEAFDRVRAMYLEHEVSGSEAATLLHVSRGTFYRWLKESGKE